MEPITSLVTGSLQNDITWAQPNRKDAEGKVCEKEQMLPGRLEGHHSPGAPRVHRSRSFMNPLLFGFSQRPHYRGMVD